MSAFLDIFIVLLAFFLIGHLIHFNGKLHVVLQDCYSEYLLIDSLLSHFDSMERILERYEKHMNAQSQLIANDLASQVCYHLLRNVNVVNLISA